MQHRIDGDFFPAKRGSGMSEQFKKKPFSKIADALQPFSKIADALQPFSKIADALQPLNKIADEYKPQADNSLNIAEICHSIKQAEQRDLINAIQQAMQTPTSPQHTQEIAPQSDAVKQSVNIPASLWAGKTPPAAYNALKNEYEPCVIAVILNKMGVSKLQGAQILSQDTPRKGKEPENSTFIRRFDKLLSKANRLYSFTFDEKTQ